MKRYVVPCVLIFGFGYVVGAWYSRDELRSAVDGAAARCWDHATWFAADVEQRCLDEVRVHREALQGVIGATWERLDRVHRELERCWILMPESAGDVGVVRAGRGEQR